MEAARATTIIAITCFIFINDGIIKKGPQERKSELNWLYMVNNPAFWLRPVCLRFRHIAAFWVTIFAPIANAPN